MDGADEKLGGFNPWQNFCDETGWPDNLMIEGERITREELEAMKANRRDVEVGPLYPMPEHSPRPPEPNT